ncbi:Flap-structured DNA-binding and RNA-binding protein [Coemansia biformis]|uniref:Flap-structured DNA-binding and RNA-binding protein n=1 Tax=Coemansia biformis TaxID=1286918 RepID=A0A9W7XQ18_9FUNG|nr:Flap-structured DNA-binding and RNA-binding protein [Coemansia biformis]
MEPKDFRWSSLTESMEPFGNIGADPNASALTHILETNLNRTSGIAARRSVSSRLSIPVKSPRDTLQTSQQQQLAASLAQLSMSGVPGSGQHISSPLAASFAHHHHQQQQNASPARVHYTQAAAGAAGYPLQYHPQGYAGARPHGIGGPAPGMGGGGPVVATPPRTAFAPPEVVDLQLVRDIPAWLRSMRLHKYTECFSGMDWTSVVSLSDEQLQAKGVSALGARRKMLKVFEAVLEEVDQPPQ